MTDTHPARAAFQRGAYDEARAQLAHPLTGEDCRLLLTIASRQRDWKGVSAAALQLQDFGGDYERLGRVFAAYAHRAVTGETVAPAFEHAADPEIHADIVRTHALLAWMHKRYNEARALLSSTSPVTPTQRVQYLELRAWCTQSHSARTPILMNALTLAIDKDVDVGLIGIIAHPVAVLARETNLGHLTNRARELLNAIAWEALENDERFYTERALAWLIATSGDYIDALYRLDQLLRRANNPQQRALAATDRARVCKLASDPINATVAARHALDAFEDIAWETPQNDVPVNLYGAVDVIIEADETRTRSLIATADAAMLTPALGARTAPITEGFRNLAHAIIARDDTALALARTAYRIFHDANYDFRAALAALRAYDCSHVPHWREKVVEYVGRFDRSPLARELAWRTEPLQRITPRRRAILDRVAALQTNKEIAIGLGLSENTVKEHIRMLHRIFNVTRRSELAAAWTHAQEAA